MALFESYERRIDKINAVLAQYGIKSVEEAKAICDEKGIDPYKMCEETQPICFDIIFYNPHTPSCIAIVL